MNNLKGIRGHLGGNLFLCSTNSEEKRDNDN